MATPIAGKSHHVVLAYGNPSSPSYVGLMLPSPNEYITQPYTPFAPASRQGDATNKDFNITAVWELCNSLELGMGHLYEQPVEFNGYQFAQGQDGVGGSTYGPCLFSAKKGALRPPAADTSAWTGIITRSYAAGNLSDDAAVGDVAWTGPGDASTSNDVRATSALTPGQSTHYLKALIGTPNFPTGYTPASIVVTVERSITGTGTIKDSEVKLVVGGAVQADNQADLVTAWPASDATVNYTFSTGLPTAAQMNAATFGFVVRAACTGNNATARIDWVQMRIYYLIDNFKQFIQFNGGWYGLTSDTPGRIFQYSSGYWGLVETLTNAGKQLYTSGDKLYATQGQATAVRQTTDGTTWSDVAVGADYVALREEGNFAYMQTATLKASLPGTIYGPKYRGGVVGWPGTTATNLMWFKGSLYIGKPEGLFKWTQGNFEAKFPTPDQFDTTNFTKMCVHHNLLYFNVKNRLFFTDGTKETEVLPEEIGGFTAIDSLSSTFGPLLIGGRVSVNGVVRSYLWLFWGADSPGLHPLWSDADGSKPIVACGATDIFASPAVRVYFSQTGAGTFYLDLNQRFHPNTYHVLSATASFLDLVEFSAGFRTVPKWFYEVVLNVRNPTANTSAYVYYSVDGGAWTQSVDNAGAAHTLALSSRTVGTYFPLNTTGLNVQVRIYLWTTNASTVAEISHITVRGTVMVKPRAQISLPVVCGSDAGDLVPNLNGVDESGADILTKLRVAATQGYPCKLQDMEQKWHLVLFRTPYPLEAARGYKDPQDVTSLQTFKTAQLMLVEIDSLTSTGALNVWAAG